MEIISTAKYDPKKIIVLPPSCVDPQDYKVGDDISYEVHGTVKSIDKDYGTTIELDEGEQEEDLDEFESMDDDEQKSKIKKQMDKKNKLEEY